MSPNNDFILNSMPVEPVSRTYQYRKIMKPMLERKRRARINKCLDELKILMTGTLIADGENISKLEKADILEFTVRHLQRLRQNNDLFIRHSDTLKIDKFWDGFQYCATEVTQFLYQYDCKVTSDVVKHILNYASKIAKRTPQLTQLPQSVPTALTALNLQANREFIQPKPIAVDQRFNSTITRVNSCLNDRLSSNQKKAPTLNTAAKANCIKDCTVKVEVDMDVNVDVEVEVEVEVDVEDSNNVWRPW